MWTKETQIIVTVSQQLHITELKLQCNFHSIVCTWRVTAKYLTQLLVSVLLIFKIALVNVHVVKIASYFERACQYFSEFSFWEPMPKTHEVIIQNRWKSQLRMWCLFVLKYMLVISLTSANRGQQLNMRTNNKVATKKSSQSVQ